MASFERREHPADDEGEDEVAAAVAGGTDEPVEPDLAGGAEGGGDMAVRQRAHDADRRPVARQTTPPFSSALKPAIARRPVGQIEEGALLDLAGLAIALAQQDRGRRIAVGDGLDVHGS